MVAGNVVAANTTGAVHDAIAGVVRVIVTDRVDAIDRQWIVVDMFGAGGLAGMLFVAVDSN